MRGHDVIGSIFILILVYLLVKNASDSSKVIQGLASGATGIISTLQGQSGNGVQVPTV